MVSHDSAPRADHFARLNALVVGGWLRKLSKGELATWVALEKHAAPNGITFPAQETIASLIGCTGRNVRRHLKALAIAKLIQQTRRPSPGQCAEWCVLIPPTEDTQHVPCSRDKRTSADEVQRGTKMGSMADRNGEDGGQSNVPLNSRTAEQPNGSVANGRSYDPIWDVVARIWFGGTVAKPHQTEVGKLVRQFKELGATPEEIERRWKSCREKYEKASAHALVKHWADYPPGTTVDPELESLFLRKKAGESIKLPAEKEAMFKTWNYTKAQS